MRVFSLYSKLLLLVLSLLVVSSAATLYAVITATDNNIERQAATRLNVGTSVLESLMQNRGRQLLDSARVLTADFGFKRAVALKDTATILSVLENHGQRIEADLVTLLDLNGELIVSTGGGDAEMSSPLFQRLIKQPDARAGLQASAVLSENAYQIVLVQVRAPAPVAWAMLGFKIDKAFSESLKNTTLLDVSFARSGQNLEQALISTLPQQAFETDSSGLPAADYQHQQLTLGDSDNSVTVTLSVSLQEERARFATLKMQILVISVAVLLSSVIVLAWLLRGVVKPIRRLLAGAQRISGGDYTRPIESSQRGGSEIAQLASSFNQMQADIAAREEKIVYQAYHDDLTALPKREKVALELQQMIEQIQAQKSQARVAVISINVQRVKSINNVLGFAIGDELLLACAERWRRQYPAPHVIGRSTASEFVLLYNMAEDETVDQLATTLHQQWAEPFDVNALEINVPLVLGLAVYPDNGSHYEELLRRSDIALSRAIEHRRATEFYANGEEQQHLKQIRLINDLKRAMQNNELTLYYQPKVGLQAQRVSEVEALIRWHHPELGFIPPDEFIGLAEQSGLMPALSRWILRRGIGDASAWQQQGFEIAVAINLSAYDLMHDELPGFVEALLDEQNYSSEQLILEVTESAMMEDPDTALSVLHRFRDLGITLAIDDYGTGYSSLGQMKQLPVDELKIDMCFVRKLSSDSSDQVIVQSTIAMAHNIGLKVVAEGVEDYDAWRLLRDWGCDKLQGYVISKPLPYEDFLSWIKHWSFPQEAQNDQDYRVSDRSPTGTRRTG